MPRRPPVPKEWMRDASDEQAVSEGCWFDPVSAAFVCDFLETFCFLSEGRWAGQKLKLIPWQRDWFSRLYGWKRPDGFRRFQSTYVEIGKKNGKSPAVAGQECYHLLGDGEGGPKIYLNACDREQARIVFDTAKAMVEDPTLSKFSGFVEDSGEGRWTLMAAIEEAVPADAIAASLFVRFRSRQEHTFAEKVLSAMRFQFGGHVERPTAG